MSDGSLTVLPVRGIGEVRAGDVIADLVADAIVLHDGDVVVLTQKVVSKAEGRAVPFDGTSEQRRAIIATQAARILRRRGELTIAETRHGFVCANAGVDVSNVDGGFALLLPADPDRSARRIRDGLRKASGANVAVVISDTFGRPWRRGLTDVALGVAGVAALLDLRGTRDANGRLLESTAICVADEIASAADLVMGKSSGVPAAVVRGIDASWIREASVRDEVVRSADDDLFR